MYFRAYRDGQVGVEADAAFAEVCHVSRDAIFKGGCLETHGHDARVALVFALRFFRVHDLLPAPWCRYLPYTGAYCRLEGACEKEIIFYT